MVDGANRMAAGGALGYAADESRAGSHGIGLFRIRGSEDAHRGNAERRAQVHGARIIRHQGIETRHDAHERPKVGAAAQIQRRRGHRASHLFCGKAIGRGP